ncbi:MAG: glycogen debranching protein GlgX [Nitrospirae bacterium]|nr:glycogen debranching protein GlgX [Nitrospirota bacterium]
MTAGEGGINFSIWGLRSTASELLLFESAESREPFQVITLDPEVNRTYYSWHVFVEGLPHGTCYAWRIEGPDDTRKSGFRFDRQKALVDPHARAVSDRLWDRRRARRPGDNSDSSIRGIVVAKDGYDWEGDRPLNRAPEQSIIYELHVGGFTRHPSSGVRYPGTFSGLIEKIPYLRELGVTDVELMPVMAFDEQDVPDSAAALGLRNYWGYSTHSFFSPHPGFCISPDQGTHVREFRDMVKALHRAGIRVILDVVLNHTAEGGADGPTINFKGLGNRGFYHLDSNDRRIYRDYTGCGNTVNCNFPIVTSFLIDCLEYWVREMHVDGFRFDLASVLARGQDGEPLQYAPMPWYIELSDVLGNTRLIAEAWDAGGLYQVGDFPGYRWAEWNGRYRDVIRRFVRGDRGLIGEVATRLSGSSDLYAPDGRLPINSINFVTCHDGFTLRDLVSYNVKHNEANGSNNRDGNNDNASWNYGAEGETNDPAIMSLRKRQAKNFMAVLLLSQGVPMILSGDEVFRTQRGNNNCYCQDNELSWFDWGLTEENREMLRFVTKMVAIRKRHPCLMRKKFLTGGRRNGGLPDVTWHGRRLNEPQWNDPGAQVLAYTLGAVGVAEDDLHIMLNMSDEFAEIELPWVSGRRWFRVVDTWQPSPADILEAPDQPVLTEYVYRAAPRSVVVFEGR